jgi:hypothetical protein
VYYELSGIYKVLKSAGFFLGRACNFLNIEINGILHPKYLAPSIIISI